MFYSLRGKLMYIGESEIAIECNGIGYRCYATKNSIRELKEVGNEVFVYTYFSVREDSMELFAFTTITELNCFKMLLCVSGVGARVGIAILSTLSAEQVALAIAAKDSRTLTMAPGVGNKLAQRIILELKDKIEGLSNTQINNRTDFKDRSSSNAEAAVNALSVLGYSQSEAEAAVAKLDRNMPTEELIRNALRSMARRK